jgi:hypothetical protein
VLLRVLSCKTESTTLLVLQTAVANVDISLVASLRRTFYLCKRMLYADPNVLLLFLLASAEPIGIDFRLAYPDVGSNAGRVGDTQGQSCHQQAGSVLHAGIPH